jgi:hypothetical protein
MDIHLDVVFRLKTITKRYPNSRADASFMATSRSQGNHTFEGGSKRKVSRHMRKGTAYFSGTAQDSEKDCQSNETIYFGQLTWLRRKRDTISPMKSRDRDVLSKEYTSIPQEDLE